MAGEDYGTGADNQNPSEWLSGYAYTDASDRATVDITPLISASTEGFTDAGMNGISGDVRMVYHAIIDHLMESYLAKENTTDFDMPKDMSMSKAEVLDSTNQKKTTVYTFRITQGATVTGGFTNLASTSAPTYANETNP